MMNIQMQNDKVNLLNLKVISYKELKNIPLEVSLLQNDNDTVFSWAKILGSKTAWNIRPFEKYNDLVEVLKTWTPQIFVTHWHFGNDHRFNNPVSSVIKELKDSRGGPGIGKGPLLIGTYFEDWNYNDQFIQFLNDAYDFNKNLPIGNFDQFIVSITHRLWELLPQNTQ